MKKLRKQLDKFPHLSSGDFQPWKDMQGVDWDNDNRYDSWGNGEWPELIPNDTHLHRPKRLCRNLKEMCGSSALK
jgi:hypothetical protein